MAEKQSLYFALDVENIYVGVKDSFGKFQRVDFKKLLSVAVRNRDFSRVKAIAYAVTDYSGASREFIKAIQRVGYNVVPEKVTPKGRSRVDIRLIVDVMRNLDFDVYVIGSGDGDFLELAKFLKEKGKRVEIVCVQKDLDRGFLQIADSVNFIDERVLFEVSSKSESVKPAM